MPQNPEANPQLDVFLKTCKLFALLAFLAYTGCYLFAKPKVNNENTDNILDNIIEDNNNNNIKNDTVKIEKLVKKIVLQPSSSKLHILEFWKEASMEVYRKNSFCKPGDKLKEKKKTEKRKESDTSMQIYVVGAFVLVMVCIVMDLMDFKGAAKRAKVPLSRKCSLADLTVLKHQRKELVRKDSILETPEEPTSYNQMGTIRKPPPLQRQRSFPLTNPRLQHQFNSTDIPLNPTDSLVRRPSIIPEEARRQSIVLESRRLSLVPDSRRSPIRQLDKRRLSLSLHETRSLDSELIGKKHHIRFVHRH
ncbi:unnamed protein product [Brassicogethes aeneus]|uniref:Uncharacterized protein n=1 Tax=Brassicogethes aeneus TaxID=1431903 RepID=A0A9P0BI49_BRAAE|nr:unnamed protein product [Brassicogethes aeneus]